MKTSADGHAPMAVGGVGRRRRGAIVPGRAPRPGTGRPAVANKRVARYRRALGATGLFLLGASCAAPEPVHLVVVCIDTLRTDRTSLFGATRPTTPFLAGLRERGTLLSQVQSSSNWTVPAVASLMTGLLPARHGAVVPGEVKNVGVRPEAPAPLRDDAPLLARILAERGFATALVSGNPYLYGRFREGFERVRVANEDGEPQLAEIAHWLAESRGRRRFLYWQIMDLHQPLDPPAERATMFLETVPEGFPSPAHRGWEHGQVRDLSDPGFERYRSEKLALYDGTLRHVDDLLRRLFDELERAGALDETLVVVTADHGEEFWDHALEESTLGDDPRGIWGLGHGHAMYQELLHVPVLLVGPGIPAGRASTCPAGLTDLMPTLLRRLGLEPPAGLDGVDLGVHLAEAAAPCPPRLLLSQAPAYGPESVAARWGRWKLDLRAGRPPRLFDLAADPGERRDLASARPDIVDALERQAHPAAGDPTEPVLPADDELRRQLRALGYLP